jgi:hypothetical protein
MATATAMLAVLPMAAASAATPHVLTIAKVGGLAVQTGQVIQAPLKAGTKATFFSPGTTTGVSCPKALVTNKVVTNPLKPGTAVESLTAQTFSGCTTNIPGTTSVKSVKVLNLPYKTTISDATGFPVTVTKPGGVLKTSIAINSVLGLLTCTYRATKLSGKASNAGNVNIFKNQVFTLSSGSSACPAKGSFSATFGPLKDISLTGQPLVFVN